MADHYEFQVVTGDWRELPVSLCSTGICGGSATIALDNLVRLGATTVIYIDAGPADAGQLGYWAAAGAVRQDGASLDYVRAEFPATADSEVLLALSAASKELALPLQPALLWASVAPLTAKNKGLVESYNSRQESLGGLFAIPLVVTPPEPATILTLATLYRVRAGAVFVGISGPSGLEYALDQLFDLALSSLRLLRAWDLEKARNGWKMMTPDIAIKRGSTWTNIMWA